MNGSMVLPGGTGYDDSPTGPTVAPTQVTDQLQQGSAPAGASPAPAVLPPPPEHGTQNMPEDITLPMGAEELNIAPKSNAAMPPAQPLPPQATEQPAAAAPQAPLPNSASNFLPTTPFQPAYSQPAIGQGGMPQYTAPRPYSPQRQPVFMRNASRPYNPQPPVVQPAAPQRENSLIGPVGYDVQ